MHYFSNFFAISLYCYRWTANFYTFKILIEICFVCLDYFFIILDLDL